MLNIYFLNHAYHISSVQKPHAFSSPHIGDTITDYSQNSWKSERTESNPSREKNKRHHQATCKRGNPRSSQHLKRCYSSLVIMEVETVRWHFIPVRPMIKKLNHASCWQRMWVPRTLVCDGQENRVTQCSGEGKISSRSSRNSTRAL